MPKLVELAFTGIVRDARWLARVPVLPNVADALARSAMAVGDRGRHRAMRTVEREVSGWEGVDCGLHRLGGVEFRRGRSEFAHLHGCGLLDLRMNIPQARACVASGQAEPHHVLGDSSWVSYWIRREGQVPDAIALLRLAFGMARRVDPDGSSAAIPCVPGERDGGIDRSRSGSIATVL